MAEFGYHDQGNSEAEQKQALAYQLSQSSTGLARTGVLAGLAGSQTTTASGSVQLAAGACVVQSSVLAGADLLVNNTLKTLDVFTANPMGGLPRNDIVVFDSVTATITTIIGVPNASPSDPTVPTTACKLLRLRHAASATTIPAAKIDDLRTFLSSSWAAYTPVVKTGGAAVTLGNGTATGRYQMVDGTVTYVARFTFGLTTGFNASGPLTLSIPVTPVGPRLMFGTAGGVVGGAVFTRNVRANAGLDVMIVDASDVPVTNTAPGTWAAGNYFEISGTYDGA